MHCVTLFSVVLRSISAAFQPRSIKLNHSKWGGQKSSGFNRRHYRVAIIFISAEVKMYRWWIATDVEWMKRGWFQPWCEFYDKLSRVPSSSVICLCSKLKEWLTYRFGSFHRIVGVWMRACVRARARVCVCVRERECVCVCVCFPWNLILSIIIKSWRSQCLLL